MVEAGGARQRMGSASASQVHSLDTHALSTDKRLPAISGIRVYNRIDCSKQYWPKGQSSRNPRHMLHPLYDSLALLARRLRVCRYPIWQRVSLLVKCSSQVNSTADKIPCTPRRLTLGAAGSWRKIRRAVVQAGQRGRPGPLTVDRRPGPRASLSEG